MSDLVPARATRPNPSGGSLPLDERSEAAFDAGLYPSGGSGNRRHNALRSKPAASASCSTSVCPLAWLRCECAVG